MKEKWQYELQNGNEDVFTLIFNEYYALLCSVAFQYLRDIQLSEAVAEDVFITLWEKRESLLPVQSLKAYLLRAVRNHSIDYIRSHRNENFLDLETVDANCFLSEHDIFEMYVMKELESKINDVVANLPEECRRVYNLSRDEQKSYSEIAEELNISVNTVKYHMKNALSILRKEVGHYLATLFIALYS